MWLQLATLKDVTAKSYPGIADRAKVHYAYEYARVSE